MAEVRFTFVAGRLVRKAAIATLRDLAFMRNVVMHVEEERGFLESRFRVRMEGDERTLVQVKAQVVQMMGEWSEERAT